MDNLFTLLKSGTFQQHRKLEHSAPFAVFHNEAPIPLTSYKTILTTMYGFHRQVSNVADLCINEMEINNSAGIEDMKALVALLNIEGVVSALKADMTALEVSASNFHVAKPCEAKCYSAKHGITNSALAAADFTKLVAPPPTFSGMTSSCIAGLYVWMGSSMGANLISRRLHKQKSFCDTSLTLPTYYYDTMALIAKDWVTFKQQTIIAIDAFTKDANALCDATVKDANVWFSYLIGLNSNAT